MRLTWARNATFTWVRNATQMSEECDSQEWGMRLTLGSSPLCCVWSGGDWGLKCGKGLERKQVQTQRTWCLTEGGCGVCVYGCCWVVTFIYLQITYFWNGQAGLLCSLKKTLLYINYILCWLIDFLTGVSRPYFWERGGGPGGVCCV